MRAAYLVLISVLLSSCSSTAQSSAPAWLVTESAAADSIAGCYTLVVGPITDLSAPRGRFSTYDPSGTIRLDTTNYPAPILGRGLFPQPAHPFRGATWRGSPRGLVLIWHSGYGVFSPELVAELEPTDSGYAGILHEPRDDRSPPAWYQKPVTARRVSCPLDLR